MKASKIHWQISEVYGDNAVFDGMGKNGLGHLKKAVHTQYGTEGVTVLWIFS